MMVLAAAMLMMAVPASSFVPCSSRLSLASPGCTAAAACHGHKQQAVFEHGRAGGATGLRMADELGSIGRLAKDKLSGAKSFIEDSGRADGGINFMGAGAGAVAGGAPPCFCPSFQPFSFFTPCSWSSARVTVEETRPKIYLLSEHVNLFERETENV